MTPDMANQPDAPQRSQERAAGAQTAPEPSSGVPDSEPQMAGQVLPLLPLGASRAQRAAVGVGVAAALFGVTVLGYWLLGRPPVVSGSAAQLAKAGNTAVAFLLAGLALAAAGISDGTDGGVRRLRPRDALLLRRVGRLFGSTVLVLGCLSLVDAIGHIHASLLSPGSGRTAVVTALYFIAVGTALLFLDSGGAGRDPRRGHPTGWLAYGAAWLGGLVLTGHLLRVPRLHDLDITVADGLPPAVAMVALALGILAVRPQRGLTAVALSSTVGGTLMRRLVPASLFIPPLGMWILVGLAPRLGLLEDRFATALATMAGCAIVAALAATMARRLASTDGERQAYQLWLRRDLPELAQALRERDRTRIDLERINHDLDEFTYAASHDLRAPLRGIANLAQWVEEDLGEGVASTTRHQLDLLRGRVHRMEALIDDILAYSRAGRSSAPPCEVAVAELLAETIERLAPPPEVRITVQPAMPKLVTEREQLQLVFTNLLNNALKHARRADVCIEVSAEEVGDFVRFTVADNGPGIAPQYHDRIWGMFQTLASRDEVEGTGIGLATVKKLVERHGGRVGVESAEGQGARFFFLWPRPMIPISST